MGALAASYMDRITQRSYHIDGSSAVGYSGDEDIRWSLAKMAHKFDTIGLVGDKWMCSNACICEDLKLTVGDNANTTATIISPSTIYGNFSEEELAPYERTNLIN